MNGLCSLALAAAVMLTDAGDDYTPQALREQEAAARARYGGSERDLPLDVKAEFFEWQLWRYHRTPFKQVYNAARLPGERGKPSACLPGSDTSTWNGALLAALSYKYAVTKDAATLARIGELLEGLHLFFAITTMPGLPARTMTADAALATPEMQPGVGPDGAQYFYRADPAKGTVNQIACGYAAMRMHAYNDLPPATQAMAQGDLTAMVLHVIDRDYHLTHRDGKRTTYGDLTPVIGSIGVPFNGQLAYHIVALGNAFPPADAEQKRRIDEEFHRLRVKHHVYYEDGFNLVQPQRVAASSLLKGMNDRNHAINAAFSGLWLEIAQARAGRPLDRNFVYELGQTMCFGMERIGSDGNALCNFMWAALIADAEVFEAMVRRRPENARALARHALGDGVEQLRRFKLDRFSYPGRVVPAGRPLWVDQRPSDDYQWKADPPLAFQATGPASDTMFCAIDYLYAYWMMRHYRLDGDESLQARHGGVLGRTPGLAISPAADGSFLPARDPGP